MIGAMRHRVTLQRTVRTPDDSGGNVVAWADVATLWAEVEPITAQEAMHLGRLAGEVTHRITLRYRDGVTTDMRLLLRGRPLDIVGVRDLREARRFLVLECRQR